MGGGSASWRWRNGDGDEANITAGSRGFRQLRWRNVGVGLKQTLWRVIGGSASCAGGMVGRL